MKDELPDLSHSLQYLSQSTIQLHLHYYIWQLMSMQILLSKKINKNYHTSKSSFCVYYYLIYIFQYISIYIFNNIN
jgi:hypothetical protein